MISSSILIMHLQNSYFNNNYSQQSKLHTRRAFLELIFEINNQISRNIFFEEQKIFKKLYAFQCKNMITEKLTNNSMLQMRNSFFIKNNSYTFLLKYNSENKNLKNQIIKADCRGRLNQIENLQKVFSQKQKCQISEQSIHKDDSFQISKKEICSNTPDSINSLVECQAYNSGITISKQIKIKLLIKSKNDVKRVIKNKKGWRNIQNSQEQIKNLKELINFSKKILSKQQTNKQINIFFKNQLSKNKNQLMGGGGCCSRPQINENNFNPISLTDETYISNNLQSSMFEKEFQKWTNQETIIQSIQKQNQQLLQSNLLQQCIIDQIINHEELINNHKSQIQDIFETYILLEMTTIQNKSEKNQEKFEKIFEEIKSINVYEQDYPVMELVFYIDILTNLNKINNIFNENQQTEFIKIKELIQRILSFQQNEGKFSEIVQNANAVKQIIQLFDKKKEFFPLKYQTDIWVKKIDQFGDKFISQDITSEILFYIKIFFENYKQNEYQDYIILTLIRINYLLEKIFKNQSQQNDKNNIYHLFSNNLIKSNIDEFLSELMQKSDLFNKQVFLIFSIENQSYRYITLSILININSLFTITAQNTHNQEYISDFLCNQYLIEGKLEIRVLFEKSTEFVQFFNQNIKSEVFKQRIINFDKQRKDKLLPFFPSLQDHERSINTFDDIIKLISDNAIQKWERDIKKRQRQNLAQKDDVLLEVKELYINQMITYLKGNQIFKKQKLDSDVEEFSTSEQNALQDILNLFLNPNYQYTLKRPYQDNRESEQKFKDQSNQCQILGILAEGGTGKSMLMKKIETFLIEKLSKLNTETETGNYLPLLIKCNSLDSENPSIQDYLKQQGGINEDQIQHLKQNDRNKLILLDGYDEYTGEYFFIYNKLNLNEWKNTKIIVATRKEKLSQEDACAYFSKQNKSGLRDEMSYSLVKLEEFTTKDIHEYAERYFKQERKTDKLNIIEKDITNLNDCLKNLELEKLLHLPINLYLFTRMLVNLNQEDIQNLKSKVSDQNGIQEIFFSDQFEREAQSFIDSQIHSTELKQDQNFRKSLINCYFEYFQSIAMTMFENRGQKSNFLQVEKQNINFNIQQSVIHSSLNKNLVNTLMDKIQNYINSKIVTRSKEEVDINQKNQEQCIKYLIEFKHKSLFEYFVARSMKYDFNVHGDNIFQLSIEQLKEFSINKKSIMNAGENQSEQQILLKLFQLIRNEIEQDKFYSTYYLEEIEKNSGYIQYIKKSEINSNSETSQIDVGASNILSVLFLSKFCYSQLELNFCSFSKLYVPCKKSDLINFDNCNLQNSYLKYLQINFDSCNTQFATFDVYKKIFDTSDSYSFHQVIWDKRNILYAINKKGFINSFKIENQNNIVLQKSKQLSQTPLSQILIIDSDTLLVSSLYSLLLVNSSTFELLQSYKFKNNITGITIFNEQILLTFKNRTVFQGSFEFGFRKLDMHGHKLVYNEPKQILLLYTSGYFYLYNTNDFSLINTIDGFDESIITFSADGKFLATSTVKYTCEIWNAEKGFELINTLQGHTYRVCSAAFSTDGKYLATGSKDKTCKIWNVDKNFELITSVQGHHSRVRSIAFSADGKYLSTVSKRETCIWNTEQDFEFINNIYGHTSDVTSVAFSKDGKYLATGQDDTCKIWNVEEGFKLINTIQSHHERIKSIAFSAIGKYLATGSSHGTCKIWNVEIGFVLIKTFQAHFTDIDSVSFSVDGKYLATGSSDDKCKIWNIIKDFELTNIIQGHTSKVKSVVFSTDGKYLATGSLDKTCKIWNVEEGFELINTIQGHTNSIFSVAFSVDGKYLATGSQDNTCKIWNAEKGFELINTIYGHRYIVYSISFTVDGKYLATGSQDNTCKIWNIQKGFELINTIQGHTKDIFSVAFSVDGKYLATGSRDKTCKIWDAEKGFEIIQPIQGHTNTIFSVAFSANGKYLVTGSMDKTFKISNVNKGFELIHTIKDHTEIIFSVAFSLNGKFLATGSEDKTCKIWNVENNFKLIYSIDHRDSIKSVAFSADGKYLATGSSDKTCKIWNAEKSFELINTIQGHTNAIFSVVFSVDGKYLATGSSDYTCKIWNTEKSFQLTNTIKSNKISYSIIFSADGKYLLTGLSDDTCKIWNAEKEFELINTLQGHTGSINSIAFSPDGVFLATGSQDNTCKIWNIEKGFELTYTIQCHTQGIRSIAFSSDRKYLATGSLDNTCKIWNVEKGFQLINIIQGHSDAIKSFAYSVDGKYICLEYDNQNYSVLDSQNIKIISEQNKYEELNEYQFEQNQNYELEKMIKFENMYVL